MDEITYVNRKGQSVLTIHQDGTETLHEAAKKRTKLRGPKTPTVKKVTTDGIDPNDPSRLV